MKRVFVDTNVWFSAFYGSKNSEKILQAHIEGRIKSVISQEVLEELVRNIKQKVPDALGPLQKFLENSPPEVVRTSEKVPRAFKSLIHPKDQIIFNSAQKGKTSIFVTGNVKDFDREKLYKLTKIKILTPKEFVKELDL